MAPAADKERSALGAGGYLYDSAGAAVDCDIGGTELRGHDPQVKLAGIPTVGDAVVQQSGVQAAGVLSADTKGRNSA